MATKFWFISNIVLGIWNGVVLIADINRQAYDWALVNWFTMWILFGVAHYHWGQIKKKGTNNG